METRFIINMNNGNKYYAELKVAQDDLSEEKFLKEYIFVNGANISTFPLYVKTKEGHTNVAINLKQISSIEYGVDY